MKLLRDYLFFTLFIYICLPATACNACCLDKDVKKLKKEVENNIKLIPVVLQAVSDQCIDPENSQDRALQEFVTQVSVPALNQFNEILKLLLANPWMEKASEPLVQEIRQSNPELVPISSDPVAEYENLAKFMTLYQNKLDERHPQPCPHCKGSFMQKASRCHFLHEGHAAMMPIVDSLRKGVEMKLKHPDLTDRYQQLVSAVQKGNTTPFERRPSTKKIGSEPTEGTYLLEVKTPG